jgi:PAS domain S-box-containing protein
MKIGRRLFIGFAIIILINVAAGTMIINNVGSVQHYYDNKKTMDSLISHLDDCRLAESKFRSTYDTNLVTDFQSDYLNVSRDISNIGALQNANVDDSNLSAIKLSVDDYRNYVLDNVKYSNNIENLWRSEQDTIASPGGLNADLNATSQRVVELAATNNLSWSGMLYLNYIEQDDSNFLSTHNNQYLDDLYKRENLLSNWANNDPLLAQDIWRYNNNLNALTSLYSRQADTGAHIDSTVMALENNVSTMDMGVSTAFDNTLQRTILTVIGLIALSLVLSIAISLLVTRSISKPIESLSMVAQKIASGDMRRKVEINRKDEIGSLADSFSKMMTSIRSRMEFNDALVRNIVDAHMIAYDDGTIFYFNKPAIKMTGYSYAEATNMRYQDMLRDTPIFTDTTNSVSYSCTLVKKDMSELLVRCNMSTINDGEGNKIGTMILIRDMSF